MLNLCLHCGARSVDREAVEAAATPERTRSWVPIPHHHLLKRVESTLTGFGLEVVGAAHALWNGGLRYFGLLEGRGEESNGDYGLVVGLRNSHDKSFPASIALGSGVFVCDNLAFSGEVTLSRKHTTYIERDLPQVVHRAVGQLGDLRRDQDRRIVAYRQTELTEAGAHDLVIRALDADVLPVTRVPTVLSEWRTPRYPEFAESGPTVWRLFNAVTEALKARNLPMLPYRTQALHGLLDTACGLAA